MITQIDPVNSEKTASLTLACRCAQIAEDYRGENTMVLDLREITPLFDFFVITTGRSRRQMHAIAEEIDSDMAKAGSNRMGLEGYRESAWIIQDYGDIVLHVFDDERRDLYDLEGLWGDAGRIDWRAELGLPPAENTES